MPPNQLHGDRELSYKDGMDAGNGKFWNLGDTLHLIQIAVLLISLGVIYEKFDIFTSQVTTHTRQLDRIEHYLSSKDSHYWDASRKSE